MQKIDFKKELKHLYKPSTKNVELVSVPKMQFLMIDGEGNPGTAQSYLEAIQAIYPVAYTIKFMIKKGETGIDFGVLPLEGLWWADDMMAFSEGRKDEWKWRLMIMQPEYVTTDIYKKAILEVGKKKNPIALNKIRLENFTEGKAVQIMHIGPFSEEGPNIEKLHSYIKESGHEIDGLHHEIYLSDIRRAAPEKWKTIIRQPYK